MHSSPSAGLDLDHDRPQKITFAEMRDMGVRGLLVYCADYAAANRWPSAATLGRMIFDYPISKAGSSASFAASGAWT
jgi:hypothetical protein